MSKQKIPAAAWTTATGDKLKEAAAQHNAEEIGLQLPVDSLVPVELAQIAPGVCFSKPVKLRFHPDSAPQDWEEEFDRMPRT